MLDYKILLIASKVGNVDKCVSLIYKKHIKLLYQHLNGKLELIPEPLRKHLLGFGMLKPCHVIQEYKCSYPTARKMLDSLRKKLGLPRRKKYQRSFIKLCDLIKYNKPVNHRYTPQPIYCAKNPL